MVGLKVAIFKKFENVVNKYGASLVYLFILSSVLIFDRCSIAALVSLMFLTIGVICDVLTRSWNVTKVAVVQLVTNRSIYLLPHAWLFVQYPVFVVHYFIGLGEYLVCF